MKKIREKPPAIILSGGSELVSLGIAEALGRHDVPVVALALGRKSLIRDMDGIFAYAELPWPPENVQAGISYLKNTIRKTVGPTLESIPVFPTEDGGLRFLVEGYEDLKDLLAIPFAREIPSGGLDKAKTFERLQNSPFLPLLPRTLILDHPEQAIDALETLGRDAVFKPAIKPLEMDLGPMESKTITLQGKGSIGTLIAKLKKAWSVSERWVVQERLLPTKDGELLWWGARDSEGKIRRTTATEKWKYPKYGGSACWVISCINSSLDKIAYELANFIDVLGMVEFAFMESRDGSMKLVEMNPRPCLHVALQEMMGCELVYWTYCALAGLKCDLSESYVKADGKSWVNPERLFMSAVKGEYGRRLPSLARAARILLDADYVPIYSNTSTKLIARWWLGYLRRRF